MKITRKREKEIIEDMGETMKNIVLDLEPMSNLGKKQEQYKEESKVIKNWHKKTNGKFIELTNATPRISFKKVK